MKWSRALPVRTSLVGASFVPLLGNHTVSIFKSQPKIHFFLLMPETCFKPPPCKSHFCLCQPQHSRSLSLFLQTTLVSLSALVSTHAHIGKNSAVHIALPDKSRHGGRFAGTRAQWHVHMNLHTQTPDLSPFLKARVHLLSHVFLSICIFCHLFTIKPKTVCQNFLYKKWTWPGPFF